MCMVGGLRTQMPTSDNTSRGESICWALSHMKSLRSFIFEYPRQLSKFLREHRARDADELSYDEVVADVRFLPPTQITVDADIPNPDGVLNRYVNPRPTILRHLGAIQRTSKIGKSHDKEHQHNQQRWLNGSFTSMEWLDDSRETSWSQSAFMITELLESHSQWTTLWNSSVWYGITRISVKMLQPIDGVCRRMYWFQYPMEFLQQSWKHCLPKHDRVCDGEECRQLLRRGNQPLSMKMKWFNSWNRRS